MSTPKIFVFCNSCVPQWHAMLAIAEDGTVLGGHMCSNHSFAMRDMGVRGELKHDRYALHYPDGFEVVFVEEPSSHPGLTAAVAANQATPTMRERP